MTTNELKDARDEIEEAIRARPYYGPDMRRPHPALAIGKRLFQEGGIDLLKRVRSEVRSTSFIDSVWTGESDEKWGDVTDA